MDASKLFEEETDWATENQEELNDLREALTSEGIDVLDDLSDALRVLEIHDVDISTEVSRAMDSGEVVIWAPAESGEIEERLLRDEDDYSVRIAIVDNSKPSAVLAIEQAMVLDADIIVATPYKVGTMNEVTQQLANAAQNGHAVVAIG
ncbi:MAG TPA: hypothetical protein VM432_05250 [Bdellovibrionales bacterium]|jgi:hypothetical protein|nr:hypothetical protein [Bdellovibrionales bacterium]